MATYDEYGPSRSDIRAAFDKAAAEKSRGYLTIIEQVLEDKYAITSFSTMRVLDHPCEIVPLLREEDTRASYATHRLSHVLDLKKDFDAQMALWGKSLDAVLPAFVVKDLAEYQADKDFARKQAEWQSQPWLTRMMTTPPMRKK